MKELSAIRVLLVAILITLAPASARAIDHQEVHAWWEDDPEVGQSHPKKIQFAMVVDEDLDLVACHLWYEQVRVSDGSQPAISGTGRMKAILKVLGAKGKRKIAKYSKEVLPEQPALLGWANGTMQNQYLALQYGLKTKKSGRLPVQVEAGDMVLWTLKFSGMPPVEVESDGTAPFRDYLWAWAWCESCGTEKSPCPDSW